MLIGAVLAASCSFQPTHVDQTSGDGGGGDGSTGPSDAATTCSSGETTCMGRVLETCGANGMWDPAQNVTCDFTCAQGVCVAPSNIDLPTVAACGSSTPPVLDPGPTGTVTYQGGSSPTLACSPACGSATTIAAVATITNEAWFCVASINLQPQATLIVSTSTVPTASLGLIVDGAAVIAGRIAVDGGDGIGDTSNMDTSPGGIAGPGGFTGAEQDDSSGESGGGAGGGHGGANHSCDGEHWFGGGGGGGGNFSGGGSGGNAECSSTLIAGGIAGAVAYSANLVPLVGGGGGGGGGDATNDVGYGWPGGGGGGGVQIAARISIAIPGEISARGGTGYGVVGDIDGGGGGGAGGGVLLESPTVSIAGSIVVDGGDGGPSAAGVGGPGATGVHPAVAGASFTATSQGGAGGGGGGGIVQIRSVAAACAAGISPTSACVLGMLTTAVGFDSLSARP
jgi:hypothetical protein